MEIITRDQWGARYGRGFGPAPLPAADVWLHHSVTSAPRVTSSRDLDVMAVRLLENIGQQRFGGGISYTFAVCPSGRVFDGHGVDRRGAHTLGHNTSGRAIVLVGNHERDEPTPQALDAVAQLLVTGHRAGWWRRPALSGGHRDASGASTDCPGRLAHRRIPDVNAAAAALLDPDPNGDRELNTDQARQLAEVHKMLTKTLDYRNHHGDPTDDTFGSVLSIRQTVQQLAVEQPQVGAVLADLQTRLGDLARQLRAGGCRCTAAPAPDGG
jgi:hypothetical protein